MKAKRHLSIVICIAVLLSSFALMADAFRTEEEGVILENAKTMRDQGLEWLKAQQQADGSWVHDIGVTSLVTLAFLNAGFGEDDTTVRSGINYILGHVQPDGSITSGTYANYYSAVAIIVLVATGNPAYDPLVKKAAQFIIDIQNDDDSPNEAYRVSPDDWRWGGIGYGGDGRPDLSNQQFALMALHAAESALDDFTVPAEVWSKSLKFLDRTQNLPAVNDQAWVQDADAPSDGGYIYFPGNSLAGGYRSYGSMTGAGLWCYLLSGGSLSDVQTVAALGWVEDHYAWDSNPNFESHAMFYYQWTLARALTLAQVTSVVDASGTSHDWFSDLTTTLSSLRSPEGFWLNTESSQYWEDIPELATAFAILALETRVMSGYGSLIITLTGDIEFNVLDEAGYIVGEKVKNGRQQVVTVPVQDASTFRIDVVGSAEDDFSLEIVGVEKDRQISQKRYIGHIEAGETKSTNVVVSAVAGGISVFGGDIHDGPKQGDSDIQLVFLLILVFMIIMTLTLVSWEVTKKRRYSK